MHRSARERVSGLLGEWQVKKIFLQINITPRDPRPYVHHAPSGESAGILHTIPRLHYGVVGRQNMRSASLYLETEAQEPESVFFYTFHKCASSLFSGFVLKNIEGLRHVDYAEQIYLGQDGDEILFEPRGCIYGPIRLSADPVSDVYKKLVMPTASPEFVKDKIAVFLVRDPRDILVSTYYSFGFSHGFSPVEEIRRRQEQIRNEIQQKGVDEYALENSLTVRSHFERIGALREAGERNVLLTYEQMIQDWPAFVRNLTRYLRLSPFTLARIHEQTRPKETEDITSHRRSGLPGGFRSTLREDTVERLNRTFGGILERFGYSL